MEDRPVLRVDGLSVSFKMYDRGFKHRELQVISNLNINLQKGEIVAVAGSSGSGKSLLAHAVLGILPGNALMSGDISYMGELLTPSRIKKLRGREIAFVPQSVEYLDPLIRVGRQVSDNKPAVREVFERYRLAFDVSKMYPHELSGGMARRVLCATAAVSGANLIIADEPTPGMSKDLAKRAMKHFRDLADDGAAVMLITHDIDLAVEYSDRVSVFYAGTTVETALSSDFAEENLLRHPYTKALWRAMPQNSFLPIPGKQPEPHEKIIGCPYWPRCDIKKQECLTEHNTQPRSVRGGEVCCLYAT